MASHGTTSLYEGIPSLLNQAEDFITAAFYGKTTADARRRAYAMGLQSPLWMWTHQQITKDAGAPRELRRVIHLVHWMHRNSVEMTSIAVLLPLAWKAMFRNEYDMLSAEGNVRESPIVLAHHELAAMNRRDATKYRYRAVVYLVDALPRNLSTSAASAQPLPASEEKLISEAMGAATDAFIICADAGWMAPSLQAKWYKTFVTKLQGEQPLISYDDCATTAEAMRAADARFPSLVGPAIPLCCSRHPGQRQWETAHHRIEPCCKHFCLSPYPCHRPDHICTGHCHPGESHTACVYACGKTLACGHKCLLRCGEPCNCFEVVEAPLPCSHEKLIGLDKETLEPIYATVQHVFKGVCSDAQLPCAVEYETECARCLGGFTVKCFEAQEQGHTLEHKTMICAACRRRERDLRAKLLGELLTNAEAQKKRMKSELQRSLHHQRKAAAQGMFRPGTRVEIVDATKCVPPLFAEDDFPGIEFADMADPTFFQEMDGAYGTFVSNHVDVMDRSEVRNLVRLPSGKHVLVTDGGLRMIQALTSNITSAAPLLLTFQGSRDAEGVDSAEFATARAMVGGTYYLAQPVPCDECEGEAVVTDKVVRVVDVDPLSPAHVYIECLLTTVVVEDSAEDTAAAGDGEGGEEGASAEGAHTPKRRRLESSVANATHHSNGNNNSSSSSSSGRTLSCVDKTLRLSVPMAVLEPMPAMVAGKFVFVTAPERQVRHPHDLQKLEAQVRHVASPAVPADAHVTAAPIDPDTPYALVAVLNPPTNCEAARGPCAVLRYSGTRVASAVRARQFKSAQHRRGGPSSSSPSSSFSSSSSPHAAPTAHPLLVVVPFMFTVGDELAEAEGALDAAAQQVFEQRLRSELTALSDDLALRNEEEAFHHQQQMPPVTAAMRSATHRMLSVPVPLPAPSAMAQMRKAAMELPTGSSIATRLAHAKDKLAYKQETAQLPQCVAAMKEKAARERESDAQHIKFIRSLKH